MGKKKIVVEGIPNIRLSSKIKDKMKIAIGEYAEEKFPLPDKRPVEAWLEKVGNEAARRCWMPQSTFYRKAGRFREDGVNSV